MLRNDVREIEMYNWFHDNFAAPELCDPTIDGSMGYQYRCGGPYFADEIMHKMYDGKYPPELIDDVIKELNEESPEWTKMAH